MNKEELIIYAIKTSNAIKEERKQELIDYVSDLEEENQELKKKYLNAVADYETTMFEKEQSNSLVNSCQGEIRQLKKQLKEEKNEWINLLDMFKNQQKEFMNFLTEAINKLKLEQETSNSAILKANTDLQMEVYSIVLSKYKEIIGVLNEKINVL